MAQATERRMESDFGIRDAFASFAVKDVKTALDFYGKTLGLKAVETEGGFGIEATPTKSMIFVYEKPDHEPATFTVFNFHVEDVAKAADELRSRGIKFLSYDDPMIKTDENGIHWGQKEGGGPNIAWFNDPSGNIVSILEYY